MSIGTGILLTAIILLIAWQIERRGAWNAVGRFAKRGALASGVLLALLFAVLGIIEAADAYHRRAEVAAETRAILDGSYTQYSGVNIGMTEEEVKYVMGMPNPKTPSSEKESYWIYGSDYNGSTFVVWDEGGRVRRVGCRGARWECPSIAGIELGDSEELVTERLGSPSPQPTIKDGRKVLRYGRAPVTTSFSFEKGALVIVSIQVPKAEQSSAGADILAGLRLGLSRAETERLLGARLMGCAEIASAYPPKMAPLDIAWACELDGIKAVDRPNSEQNFILRETSVLARPARAVLTFDADRLQRVDFELLPPFSTGLAATLLSHLSDDFVLGTREEPEDQPGAVRAQLSSAEFGITLWANPLADPPIFSIGVSGRKDHTP
jgi:hypothetical protein